MLFVNISLILYCAECIMRQRVCSRHMEGPTNYTECIVRSSAIFECIAPLTGVHNTLWIVTPSGCLIKLHVNQWYSGIASTLVADARNISYHVSSIVENLSRNFICGSCTPHHADVFFASLPLLFCSPQHSKELTPTEGFSLVYTFFLFHITHVHELNLANS